MRIAAAITAGALVGLLAFAAPKVEKAGVKIQTSDRCLACHVGLTTASGEDVSIGYQWRASLMANSSRDPYWQASVRREVIDHPESQVGIEDECSACHMPVTRFEDKQSGKKGQIFAHLPFRKDAKRGMPASDGVTCSLCHQISAKNLGTRDTFNGEFYLDTASPDGEVSHEYGPYDIEAGQQRIMQTSSEGFLPQAAAHIQKSELCASCHTLYTAALGPNGQKTGTLPEQVPFFEWKHSVYNEQKSCQDCHMPTVTEDAPITRVFGTPRSGMKRHVFVAANFFMEQMLNQFRDALEVEAEPQELHAASERTLAFLQSEAARLTIDDLSAEAGNLTATIHVENLGGHKLPTAFPSRRAWLHVTARDANGKVLFESGKQNADGSIEGNDNDADPSRFERHYTEITAPDQVEIYESILQDPQHRVTTGLLQATSYAKDNRLLPHGFNKATAHPDIAVYGQAADDRGFNDTGHRIRYVMPLNGGQGPFAVEAELRYQPIGYRWANNLKPYARYSEPKRFTNYYEAMSQRTGTVIVKASKVIR